VWATLQRQDWRGVVFGLVFVAWQTVAGSGFVLVDRGLRKLRRRS
jgi:hypothetical protein